MKVRKVKKTKRKISLKSYLIVVSFAIASFALFMLGLNVYRHALKEVSELTEMTETVTMNTINDRINEKLDIAVNVCASLQQSPLFYEYAKQIVDKSLPMAEVVRAYNYLNKMLTVIYANNPYILDIIVRVQDKMITIGAWDTVLNLDFGEISAKEEITLHYPQNDNPNALFMPKDASLEDCLFYNFKISGEPYCEVFVVFGGTLLEGMEELSSVYRIYNKDGILFYQSDEMVEHHLEEEAPKMKFASVSNENWQVVYKDNYSSYYNDYDFIFLILIISVVISLVLCILLSKTISRTIVNLLEDMFQNLKEYKKGKKKRTTNTSKASASDIRICLSILLLVVTLIPTSVFLLLFQFGVKEILHRQYMESNTALVENVGNYFNQKFERSELALSRVAFDESLLERRGGGRTIKIDRLEEMLHENIYYGLFDSIIEVYDVEGKLIYSNSLLSKNELDMKEREGNFLWSLETDILNEQRLVLNAAIHKLGNLSQSELYGYIRISMKYKELRDSVHRLAVYESDMNMVQQYSGSNWKDDKNKSVKYMQAEDGYTYILQKLGKTPCYIQSRFATVTYSGLLLDTMQKNAYIFFLLFIIIFIVNMVSFRILLPSRRVQQVLEKFTPGNVENRLSGSFIDEVNDITQSFNEMADRIDNLIDNLAIVNNIRIKHENDKKDAEIAALQMQINPHFLSNTVEAIRTVIREGMQEEACNMLASLNNLFRYAISRKDLIITVEEEIKYTKSYISLMKVRYPEIDFQWYVDETLLKFNMIKLVLQPIVENAIYHGVVPAKQKGLIQKGEISIRCERCDSDILFRIKDNGIGMLPHKLEALKKKLNDERGEGRIGIRNVQTRLKLYYGEGYGLELSSEYGGGMEVVLRVKV